MASHKQYLGINHIHLAVVLLGLILHSFDVDAFSSRIRLLDRGYRDILIAISEEVPEDPELVQNLKEIFTEVSEFMFSATNQHVYMEHIRILLPESWDNDPSYELTTWERFETSDVRIDVPTDKRGNIPYVNKPTSCGQPGLYLHMTPEYIMNKKIAHMYGPYDKTLTHEWAHLRWGVFDEYPLQGDPRFYAASDGSIQGSRCVLAIQGEWRRLSNNGRCSAGSDGFPVENDCYFADSPAEGSYSASLMYRQYLEGLETFCDDEEHVGEWEGGIHNTEAPNKQNKQCDGKSVWEVMREHSDFANYGRHKDTFPGSTEPVFTILKKTDSRNVIVLDTSGSMDGERMRLMRAAAYNLIVNVIPEGSQLGIVSFYSRATTLSELTTITNEGKMELLSQLPVRPGGGTSIASGVIEALKVLANGNNGVAAGGRLLVITDGEENSHPKLETLGNTYGGVVIDTIAVGPDADPYLEELARQSGGQSYYHLDSSSDILSAFTAHFAAERVGTSNKSVEILSDFTTIRLHEELKVPFVIDKSINGGLNIIIGSWKLHGMKVSLKGPNTKITESSPEYHNVSNFDLIRIELKDKTSVGQWKLKIRNNLDENLDVTILIEARAAKTESPIEVTAQWAYTVVQPPQKQILYVTVAQGYVPVINSKVEATVEISHETATGTTHLDLLLLDSGTGADVGKDDGIYSAFFTSFLYPGRYGVTVRVKNLGNTTKIAKGTLVGFGAAVNPAYEKDQVVLEMMDTGDFQRQATGGSFQCMDEELCRENVDNYPPAKITDLTATNVNFDLKELNITFTAPGDDLMEGRVTAYEIWYSKDFQLLRKNYTKGTLLKPSNFTRGNVSQPGIPGQQELFTIRASEGGSFSYTFAVIAIDDEGNKSPISNLAASSALDFRHVGLPWYVVILLILAGLLLIAFIVFAIWVVCNECKRREIWVPKKLDVEANTRARYTECKDFRGEKLDIDPIYENANPDAIYQNVSLS